MRTLVCLIFIALAYATEGAPSFDIDNGKDASIGKFKYQVSLRQNGSHICSGSILNNFNVLTSARCVVTLKCLPDEIKAHVGTNFLNQSGYIHDIESINVHQNYDNYLRINDVALIHLKIPIRYNVLVQPISLAKSDKGLEGKPCTLSEWGYSKVGNTSNNLQEIELIVYNQKECAKKHWRLTDNHICTLSQKGIEVCRNDFGGPLVVNGVQIGIASFGNPCELKDPAVYTRVTSFLPWITANLKT